jgi:GMP synthase-like glutamine amidotransferase
MRQCLIVQHVPAEPSWAIGAAFRRVGIGADVRRTFAGDALPPDTSGYGGVVVMGGPMSACSDHGFATRQAELGLLGDALGRAVPTLGVCLGAQLLALAAGASAYPGAHGPEIGWSTVDLLEATDGDALFRGIPGRLPVLQWHADTFDLPRGAVLLARSARYPNQAFRVEEAAWGLQFHLEVTMAAVEGLLEAFPAEAARAPGGAAAVEAASVTALGALAMWRDLVFDRFAGLVGAMQHAPGQAGSRDDYAHISES